MNFFNKDTLKVRPKFPEFERNNNGTVSNFFTFLFSILFWVLTIFIFLVVLYTQWFILNLVYLLQLIHPKHYHIPFWFGLIFVILLFPFTLFVILTGVFVKIVIR